MKRFAPHLAILLGTILMLYVGSQVSWVLTTTRRANYTESWGWFTLRVLVLAVIGLLLSAPTWLPAVKQRQGYSIRIGILALYVIPGAILAMSASISNFLAIFGSWYGWISAGSAGTIGSLLIGYGVGQSITRTER